VAGRGGRARGRLAARAGATGGGRARLLEAGARDWRRLRGERQWPRRLKATPAIEGNDDWRCPILLLFSLVHPIVVVA